MVSALKVSLYTDGELWVVVQSPVELIPPPLINFHKPRHGEIAFSYYGPYAPSVGESSTRGA